MLRRLWNGGCDRMWSRRDNRWAGSRVKAPAYLCSCFRPAFFLWAVSSAGSLLHLFVSLLVVSFVLRMTYILTSIFVSPHHTCIYLPSSISYTIHLVASSLLSPSSPLSPPPISCHALLCMFVMLVTVLSLSVLSCSF